MLNDEEEASGDKGKIPISKGKVLGSKGKY